MPESLRCPDCGAPLAITTEPANGYNEWSVVCSAEPYRHAPSVYDWPSAPVVVSPPPNLDALEAAAAEAITNTYGPMLTDEARGWIQKGIEGMRYALAAKHV